MSAAWTVRVNGRGTTLVEDANGCAIAEAFAPRNGASAMETARLIAAAPDLLAALQAVEKRLAVSVEVHFTGYAGDKALLADVRAAIAKAVQS